MNKARSSKIPGIKKLFKNTLQEITALLDNALKGIALSDVVIDEYTAKFCNDHVKCVTVFPVSLVSMSISATPGDDVQFKYSVRTSPEHSWKPWVTVKPSLLIKKSDGDGILMGQFFLNDIIGI